MSGKQCPDGVLLSCSDGVAGAVIALAMVALAATIVVGVRRHRPTNAALWRTLAAAVTIMGLGRLVGIAAVAVGAPEPVAGTLAVGSIAAGLVLAIVGAHGVVFGVAADREATVDALVVAIATGLALWQVVVTPMFAAAGASPGWTARTVTVVAVCAFAALLRVSFTPRHNTTGRLVTVSGSVGMLGTVLAVIPRPNAWILVAVALTWALCVLGVMAAVLHPSLRTFDPTLEGGGDRPGRGRLLVVIAALVAVAPIAMLDFAPKVPVDFIGETVATLLVIAIGGTRVVRLLRDDDAAEQQVRRQLELQAAVADLGKRTFAATELQAFVDALVATAAEMLGADAAAVLEVVGDGEHLRYRGTVGFPGSEVATGRVGRQQTLAGAALEAGRPVVVEDLLSDERFSGSPELRRMGFVSGIVAPVSGRERTHGVLAVFTTTRRRFNDPEVGFLEVAAHTLAATLDRDGVESRLRDQALHDALTGLPNRRHLLQRLDTACRRARDAGPTVVAIEIDGVDVVNDTLGHEAGEALVTAVAERLATCFAVTDTLGRYADDTFVGVWTGPPAACDDLVAIVIAALSPPFPVSEGEVFVRPTVGTTVGAPGVGAQELLRQADLALLWAKREGSWHAAFEPGMAVAAQQRLQLETDLRRAIDREEFVCHYQPQVDMATGVAVGLEALIRWQHPRDGLLAPGAFIEVAEQTGLIAALDRGVLVAACRQLRAWLDAGYDVPRVSVNVSAATLQHGDLPQRLAAVLAETGVSPDSIEVEITESTVMQRPDEALATLRALRETGVRIAVDDFGTGYSSLSYLQRFPVDTLKIDRSFVAMLESASAEVPVENGILAAIVAVGQHLGLGLVAEGIETPVQRDRLRALGCDIAQGYFYARPLPADQVRGWLRARGALLEA